MATNLDFIAAPGATPKAPLPSLKEPETAEISDTMIRKWVSYLLLALLAAVVVAAFIQLFLINSRLPTDNLTNSVMADNEADSARLMSLMNVVFGPIVTLFSSVVGFYFGARTAKEGTGSNSNGG